MREAVKDVLQRDLTDEERRHPWEILIDAYQRLDHAMRTGTFDSDAAYLEHIERVIRAGRAVVESKATERIALAYQRQTNAAGQLAVEAMVDTVDALLDSLGLAPDVRDRARSLALSTLHDRLTSTATPRAIESVGASAWEVIESYVTEQ